MRRNRHRVGDYLMVDDESGGIYYASEMVKIWDGSFRHEKNHEVRHPQEFVEARNDPVALRDVRTDALVAAPTNYPSGYVGNTTVPTKQSPAGHLFAGSVGIGEFIIDGPNTNTRFIVS